MMSCLILHTNSGARAALRVERLRRSIALSCALNQMYLPDGVLLRFNSRESVDWLIPTIRAISFLGHFLWSKAKICDLCSEVSCLYIRNTKIINLRESAKGASFFVLLVSLFGATRPGREATPRCFSWIRSYEKNEWFVALRFWKYGLSMGGYSFSLNIVVYVVLLLELKFIGLFFVSKDGFLLSWH